MATTQQPGSGGAATDRPKELAAVRATRDWWGIDIDKLSDEEIKKTVEKYLAPNVVFYPDGIIYKEPLSGIDEYVAALKRERAAYKVKGDPPEPLAVVASPEGSRVFELSDFELENIGKWRGHKTGKVSHISQVTELHLDNEGKVLEAWCRRQLTLEERAALLKEPEKHPPPKPIDWKDLLRVEDRRAGKTPQYTGGPADAVKSKRLAAIDAWIQMWNVAHGKGTDTSKLDALLEPDFALHDALGIHAEEKHPWQAITSREDAKRAVEEFTAQYNVIECLVSRAADSATGLPIGFAHWDATWMPKAVAGEEQAAEGASKTVRLEAMDVVVFDGPDGCRIGEIWQWRGPTPLERRKVLEPEGPDA